ncbi:hypothetical protein V1522DRAFT_413369 [Lipomyces starkeyi]
MVSVQSCRRVTAVRIASSVTCAVIAIAMQSASRSSLVSFHYVIRYMSHAIRPNRGCKPRALQYSVQLNDSVYCKLNYIIIAHDSGISWANSFCLLLFKPRLLALLCVVIGACWDIFVTAFSPTHESDQSQITKSNPTLSRA